MEHPSGPLPGSDQAAAITRFAVQTVAAALGRGPTRARTHIADGVICVVLSDTLTKYERSLLEHDQLQAFSIARSALQLAIREPLRDGVQRLTGATVESVHLDHQLDSDTLVIVLVLTALT